MRKISGFQDSIEYINHFGLTCKPGFPGWIIQAQHELCDYSDKLEKLAGDFDQYTVNWSRAWKSFTVVNIPMDNRDCYCGVMGTRSLYSWAADAPGASGIREVIRHGIMLQCNLADVLSHGSGINCDWHFERLTDGRIQAYNSYHAMTEHGFYWGYLDFSCIISVSPNGNLNLDRVMFHEDYIPAWLGGRQQMLDYLWQTIECSLEDA